MSEKLFIVMPAYNERDNISEVVSQWHKVCEYVCRVDMEAYMVIANDGSKDDTFTILKELQHAYPFLIALDKPNSGHGATVLYLYRYALEHGATYIFQTDSDGQTSVDDFWQMWELRSMAPFHIGVRNDRQDGFSRVVVTRVLRFIILCVFGVWVKDANTPFRLMCAKDLSAIMSVIPEDFFLANVAISAIALKRKYLVKWYPITFLPRQGGVNSINLYRIMKIGAQALKDLRLINKKVSE